MSAESKDWAAPGRRVQAALVVMPSLDPPPTGQDQGAGAQENKTSAADPHGALTASFPEP